MSTLFSHATTEPTLPGSAAGLDLLREAERLAFASNLAPSTALAGDKVSGPETVHILLIDPDQNALPSIESNLRHTLRDGKISDIQLTRIESTQQLQAKLHLLPCDIVLTEYGISGLSAREVLRITGQHDVDLPVIIVSDHINDQDAVEALRIGFKDYILKSNLSRLAPVIVRELNEAQERRACRAAEQALRESNAILRATQEAAGDGICLVSNEGKVVSFNSAFAALWNLSPQQAAALCDEEQLLYHVLSQLKDPDEWVEKMHYFFDNPHDSTRDEVPLQDGRILERFSAPALSPEGECYGRVWSFQDISGYKKFEEQITHQAFHDPVTSLPNRALFLDRLERTVARVRRSTKTAAVLFLDLDRFKVVNDSLGHAMGDRLLIEVATRLQSCLRPGDTAARFGGDEFTVLLEDIASMHDAIHVAERIGQAISAPFNLGTQEVHISTSIGIVTAGRDADSADDLLRKADVAMYRAKHKGRAQYAVYDTKMSAQALDRLQLEIDLRRAIKLRQLQIHFQPIVDLQRGRIIGTEALARWKHPKRGLVPPVEFVALADEIGMIVPIGNWVLREACSWTRAWQEQFNEDNTDDAPSTPLGQARIGSETVTLLPNRAKNHYPDLTVSVNLSARQFQQPNLCDNIAQILKETELSPSSLVIEITESAVMDDVYSAVGQLEALKKLGVALSMDDFGTGYSSLSSLERFPLDALKVDRAFVGRIGERGERLAIVQAICNLAHALNLRVTAEGLEAGWQVSQLRRIGCRAGQGYYFSRPIPGDEMTALLERHPQW